MDTRVWSLEFSWKRFQNSTFIIKGNVEGGGGGGRLIDIKMSSKIVSQNLRTWVASNNLDLTKWAHMIKIRSTLYPTIIIEGNVEGGARGGGGGRVIVIKNYQKSSKNWINRYLKMVIVF